MSNARYKMLIDGELVGSDDGLDVINPANGGIVARVPKATKEHVDAAVEAAKRAYPSWASRSWADRKTSLHRLTDRIEEQRTEFAKLLVEEQGKPLAQAQGEVDLTLAYAREILALEFRREILEDSEEYFVEVLRKPLGVVVGIVPWNYPVLLGFLKIVPALLCGNTIVLKPAPTTPIATLLIGELARDLLPAGVLNIIVDNNDLGSYLSSHEDVAKVSFTGSTATGKKVLSASSGTLKRVTLELGGNDAAIVLDDVDLDKAVPRIFESAFMNAGQVCIAIKRVYVPDDIYDEVCTRLASLAEEAKVGSGLEEGVTIGPLQNSMQFEKAKAYLQIASSDGQIIAGGSAASGPGYFVEPTIVRDISDGSRLVDEEQFAPILPVIRYTDIDQVVENINRSRMGLGGSVWSSDVKRAIDVARRVESGTVWINHHMDFGPRAPFGGAKESGIGADYTLEGLYGYTQLSVVNVRH